MMSQPSHPAPNSPRQGPSWRSAIVGAVSVALIAVMITLLIVNHLDRPKPAPQPDLTCQLQQLAHEQAQDGIAIACPQN